MELLKKAYTDASTGAVYPDAVWQPARAAIDMLDPREGRLPRAMASYRVFASIEAYNGNRAPVGTVDHHTANEDYESLGIDCDTLCRQIIDTLKVEKTPAVYAVKEGLSVVVKEAVMASILDGAETLK